MKSAARSQVFCLNASEDSLFSTEKTRVTRITAEIRQKTVTLAIKMGLGGRAGEESKEWGRGGWWQKGCDLAVLGRPQRVGRREGCL